MKTLALLSGGIDSVLAIKLIQRQGIEVVAINFITPFCSLANEKWVNLAVEKLKIQLEVVKLGKEYLRLLRMPKYGYGKNLNPCIDCRILMFKKAKKFAEKIRASFLISGEVLNERPMSQNIKALNIIEKEAKLEGKILRPLSAQLLPETEAEKRGWVKRKKLLSISGRSRKKQIQLAKKFNIEMYQTPAGGCFLTQKEFSVKVRDLLKNTEVDRIEDFEFLKIGRHFRFGRNKIIVGRNEDENKLLEKMKEKDDYFFEVPEYGSPITILKGPKIYRSIKKAASITLYYSDNKDENALVKFGRSMMDKSIIVSPYSPSEVEDIRIK